MADAKISALTSATTPVGGTEVLPIVQGGSTKKVSIDNLTKGRTVNASSFDTDVAAAGVTLSGTTLSADGTDANIDINITPKGTGEVNLTKVDIDGGAIDGTTIGGTSATNGTFTTAKATTFDTNVAAAKVTLSGTTLAASGTDATIDITLTPKSDSGSIKTTNSAGTTAINGGNVIIGSASGTANTQLQARAASGSVEVTMRHDITTALISSTSVPLTVQAPSDKTATFSGGGKALAISSTGATLDTSLNKVNITTPASAATLTLGSGKTFSVNNTLTLAGTDSTTMTFPTTSATIARTDTGQTFTGDQVFGRVRGISYPETSESGTTSIVDTGIYSNTAVLGWGVNGCAAYDVFAQANPNNGGSATYRENVFGTILIGGAYLGGNVVNTIVYTEHASAPATGAGDITVSAVFWDGTTESSSVSSPTGQQIRIKIAGQSSDVGAYMFCIVARRN